MPIVLAAGAPADTAALVILDVAVIVVAARLAGAAIGRVGQPAVVGEILAGIALGPSLLGALPGDPSGVLFPPEVRAHLDVLAQLGLVTFMFIVGLELDLRLIRGRAATAATISIASIVLPFTLGLLLAAVLHGSHATVAGRQVDLVPFALFIGASMSVTAFPVLARILSERRMTRTRLGVVTIACAAVDDILAWSLLALVLAVVASSGIGDVPRIVLESAAFVLFMVKVVRPRLGLLVHHYRRAGSLTPNLLAVAVAGLLVSSFVTDQIGIHAIFGAFLFGAVMPKDDAGLVRDLLVPLEQVSVLLLPVFFIVTGLSVDVGGLGASGAVDLALVLLVACSGKFLGAAAGAKLRGLPTRHAAAIGVLMNTRGLTELVILRVGLEAGVLGPRLFTILVVMAIVTTVVTAPLLRRIYPDRQLELDLAEAEREAVREALGYRVLLAAGASEDADALVEAGIAAARVDQRGELVLTEFVAGGPHPEVGGGLSVELGELAAALPRLQALAERAEAAGVRCVVRAQVSRDPCRDLLAQSAALAPDLLLTSPSAVAGDGATLEQALRAVEGAAGKAVALVVPPQQARPATREGHVVIAGSGGRDDADAFALAVRLAAGSDRCLALAGAGGRAVPRRLDAAARKAAKAGGVELAAGDAPAAVVVAGADGWSGDAEAGALVVVVSGGRGHAGWQPEPAASRPAEAGVRQIEAIGMEGV